MKSTAVLFAVISLISIVMSIREQKKKQQKKNASSAGQTAAPAPAKTESNETSKNAASFSVSAPEKEDLFPKDVPALSNETPPFPDTIAAGIYMNDEGSASEEGEDPCHNDMLTGPAESESDSLFPDTTDSRELLRAFVLNEVLSRPKALRRKA